jgi:integrase/quercetin dioxygenase-like cupin family protein
LETSDAPSNPHATPAENARFAAFAAALEREGFSPITRACYASDWWTISEHAHRSTGRKFRLAGFGSDGFRLQRAEHASKGVAPATLNRRLSFLRRYSAFAARTEPALGETADAFAALPFQSVPKGAAKALRPAEEQRLRAAADALGVQSGALVALLLGTGLRAIEVAALTRGDVIGPHASPTAVRIGGPRTKTVLLGPFAQARIAALLATEEGDETAPLFRGKSGAALGDDGIAGVVERAARDADVEATPRTLRHTFAVRYLSEHGDDVDGLAEALGQVSPATVRAYRAEAETGGRIAVAVRNWSGLDEVELQPGVRRRSVNGSRVVVERDLIAPGSKLPSRSLPTERITFVLSGRVAFRIGSARLEAGAGDFVPVPADTAHSLAACGDHPALVLHVSAQPRRSGGPPSGRTEGQRARTERDAVAREVRVG